jgi:hypothetical protein
LSPDPTHEEPRLRGLRRQSATWQLVTTALGASLWVQLFGAALSAKLGEPAAQAGAALAYLLPLLALSAGTVWRIAPLSLLAVPASFLPGLAMLPPIEHILLAEGPALLRIGLSLVLYMAAASAGLMADPVPGEAVVAREVREGGGEYMQVVYGRAVILIIVFIAPAYAVYADPAIASLMSERYGGSPQVARSFIGMLHFFVWSVMAYMLILLPVLNLEYDYKQLMVWLRDTPRQWTRAACARRASIWGALSLIALAGFALMR